MRSRPQGRRRSVDRGRGGPGIQPRKKLSPGCRRCRRKRKARPGAPISRGAPGSRAVTDPVHVPKHLAWEPGDPAFTPDRTRLGTHRAVKGHTPMMNEHGKSDRSVIPAKSPKWTLHILWALSNNGPMRFGVLRRQVEGISSRVLTERLRTLEKNGFVFRHYQAVIPPAVTYGITDRMKELEKVLAQLEDLSRKWKTEGREGTQTNRTGSSS